MVDEAEDEFQCGMQTSWKLVVSRVRVVLPSPALLAELSPVLLVASVALGSP